MTIKSNTEYDCTHQQREDHLIRAKLFHPSALLIPQSLPCGILSRRAAFGKHSTGRVCNPKFLAIFVKFKGRVQHSDGQFGVFFLDDTGDSNFRSTDHHDINVFFGKGSKHLGCHP